MCGICGFNWEDKNLIQKMTSILQHRGPDDYGFYIDKNISLGHRRLSIIDLKTGKQPIYNEDKSIVVILNGELYNYKELKEQLKNHRFYTNTDTEVLVHAYEEYGPEFIKKLNGDFAFAILDNRKKLLLLARDRLGVKPLYYYFNDNKLLFASEIKSILQDKEIKREVNFQALHNYLSFSYVPNNETMFKNIQKLNPGHYLIYQKNNITIQKYWEINNLKTINKPETYFTENLLKLLKESVKNRLMSEVPLGVFLSGGIDSSTIVAMMKEVSENQIKTFSVGFNSEEHDELKYAKIVAEHLGTDHKEIIINPNSIDILPKIIYHFDEPIADPAAIPVYLMSEKAKKYVTVTLVGEGSDEQFAGYRQHKLIFFANKYQRYIPPIVKNKILPHTLKLISLTTNTKLKKYLNFSKKLFPHLNNSAKIYELMCSCFSEEDKQQLYSQKLNKLNLKQNILNKFFKEKTNILNQLMLLETKTLLPNCYLMTVDKMTMAHSLEARVPFLDHNLLEFTATIPSKLKLRSIQEKYLIRKTVISFLPKQIIKRKKHSFIVPLKSWFEENLNEIVKQIFSEENIKKRNYFNYKYIQTLLYKNDYNKLLFLLFFELWHRMFIDRQDYKKQNLSLNKLI